jgi:hypothetical protein
MDEVNEIARLRARIESLETENARLARLLNEGTSGPRGPARSALMRERLAELEAELTETLAAHADSSARAEYAEHVLEDVVNSPSWKLTAPLRALKRRVGRRRS